MSDIVERLRALAHPLHGLARGFLDAQADLNEAADEIERRRAEIGAIMAHAHGWGLHKNCPCCDDDCPFS